MVGVDEDSRLLRRSLGMGETEFPLDAIEPVAAVFACTASSTGESSSGGFGTGFEEVVGRSSDGEAEEGFPLFFDEEGGESISFGSSDVSGRGEGMRCVAGAVAGGSVEENLFDLVLGDWPFVGLTGRGES